MQNLQLQVGNASISFSRVIKTLGLGALLASDLSFNDHISSVVRACSGMGGL